MNRSLKRVVIRVDGNSFIGFGHMSRCMALASYLKNDFKILFLISKNSFSDLLQGFDFYKLNSNKVDELKKIINKDDILVLDGYNFDSQYQKKIAPCCFKLVLIEDNFEDYSYADVIINYSYSALFKKYQCKKNTKILRGPHYLLIRNSFLKNNRRKKLNKTLNTIFISLGGSDETNQTLRVLKALSLLKKTLNVIVLVGSSLKNKTKIENWSKNEKHLLKLKIEQNYAARQMAAAISKSDLVICPASVTAWETCCIGTPLIVGYIANNQVPGGKAMEKAGIAKNISWFRRCSLKKIGLEFLSLGDLSFRREMISQQKKMIDKKSNKRILSVFKKLS